MNRITRFLSASLAVTVVMSGAAIYSAQADESAAKKHGPIAWVEKLDEAKKIAAKEKKIVFMDFYADWCGPCKQMLATTYKNPDVVARSKKFVPALINVDKNKELAEKYQISAIPAVLFLDGKGKVIVRSDGYVEAPEFLKLMDAAVKRAKQ